MDDERRRQMDYDYVTRHEWDMHLNASISRDRRIEDHMNRQDTAIDKMESTISRYVGGVAALVVVGNVIIALLALYGDRVAP